MKHTIKTFSSNVTIDEASKLEDMQRTQTLFFKNKHGQRETFSTHRGCLIVRNTNAFGEKTMRCSAIYLYGPYEGQEELSLVHAGTLYDVPVKACEHMIDLMIVAGCTPAHM